MTLTAVVAQEAALYRQKIAHLNPVGFLVDIKHGEIVMDDLLKSDSVDGFPIDARKLHKTLQIKSRFNDWVKYKIVRLNLGVDEDYQLTKIKGAKKNYKLSYQAAIKVLMSESSPKAEELRDEFFQLVSRQAKALKAMSTLEINLTNSPLVLVGTTPHLSSLSIAEITGKRHDHVLRDIDKEKSAVETVLQEISNLPQVGEIDPAQEVAKTAAIRTLEGIKISSYTDARGRSQKAYLLSEFATTQILLKYSTKFRLVFAQYFFEMKDTLENVYKLRLIDKTLPETSGKRQYIYIIEDVSQGFLKVGVASDPESRLAQLQTGNGSELVLAYTSYVCSNAFEIEAKVHEALANKHVRGEWYKASVEEVIAILQKHSYILKSALDFSLESYLTSKFPALPSEV